MQGGLSEQAPLCLPATLAAATPREENSKEVHADCHSCSVVSKDPGCPGGSEPPILAGKQCTTSNHFLFFLLPHVCECVVRVCVCGVTSVWMYMCVHVWGGPSLPTLFIDLAGSG